MAATVNTTLTPEQCFDLMPQWRGRDLDIQVLSGGITNRLFRVSLQGGGDFVVRVYGDGSELFIDRQIEQDNLQRMQVSGVTPRLVGFFPKQRVTVVEFVPGRSLQNADFTDTVVLPRIVHAIRCVHRCGARLPKVFDPLVEVKRLHAIYAGMHLRHPEFELVAALRALEQIAAFDEVKRTSSVPCHNDLLADNFILVDQPDRDRAAIVIIDWEYAGQGVPYYDLADMFQEIEVPLAIERRILELYWPTDDVATHLRLTDLFRPFPDIYWFLWSMIQINVSTIAFDYYGYGKKKFANAQANLKRLRSLHGIKLGR